MAAGSMIESIGIYLPPRVVSSRQALERCRKPISFPIEELTGIRSTHWAGDGEFAIDLAKRAVAECLEQSRFEPPDIDLLICSNISRCDGPGFRYSFEPSTAVKLKAHFGFSRALAFDVSNACPGMFTAIKIVDSYIRVGAIRRGMVVSGEYITHLTLTAQRELEGLRDPRLACLTLGDSGAAVILERASHDGVGFQRIDLYTAGAYSDLCIAKVTDRDHGGAIMYTQPAKLGPVAVRHATAHAVQTLQQEGWTVDSVRHLIPHQTSRKTLVDMSKDLNRMFDRKGWAESITVDNLESRGNTATTSHFVAVRDQIVQGRIRTGDRALFSIAGSGLTVGTALFTFDDLPDRVRRGDKPRKEQPLPGLGDVECFAPARTPVRIWSVGVVPPDWDGPRGSVEMAKVATERCLSLAGIDRSEVGLLLFTGVYRTDFIHEPATAALIAGALDPDAHVPSSDGRTTLAFDVNNGGLGFLDGCHVAIQMLRAGDCAWALVVASEVDGNPAGGPERPLGIAETASAVLVGPGEAGGFGRFAFEQRPESVGQFETWCTQRHGSSFVHTEDTGRLEEQFLEILPAAVDELLAREGVPLSAVRFILPPQRSSSFIARLTQRLGLPLERVVNAVGEGKDLFTSSVPYAFHHLLIGNTTHAGDLALLLEAGSGGQAGCALYRF